MSIPDFPDLCLRLHEKENAEWLQKQAPQTTSRDHDKQRLIEVWLRELAVRRCIWCWFGDREESMGLWNSYGARGAAIVSSVSRIRRSFQGMLAHTCGTSVGRIRYVGRREDDFPETGNDPDWLYRPYYFKHKCYSYEGEIRFVIDLYAGNTLRLGGDIFPINPDELIEEVILSPQFRATEATALAKTFPSINITFSPLLLVEEPPELRPAGVMTPRLVSTDLTERRLFGVV